MSSTLKYGMYNSNESLYKIFQYIHKKINFVYFQQKSIVVDLIGLAITININFA